MNKKYLKNWLIYILVVVCIFTLFGVIMSVSYEKSQIMNELEYYIQLNEDGSMDVTEIWDVYVKNTGTLFKDFYKTNKYPISNVSVKNLNTNETLRDLGYEIYNVPEGTYYAEEIQRNTVEIAFGTGMQNSNGNVKFQISYKIENVINSYKDCQEFYWKFLDESNSIPCKKIIGKIILPEEVSNIENLKVWGHGNFKGEINRISTSEVDFDVNNLNAGNMLEVRVVSKDKIFNVQNNEYNYNMLDNILEEEDAWSKSTNENIKVYRIFIGVLILIYIIILAFLIKNFVTFFKISRQSGDGINKIEIKYFRDIPREESSTPGEGAFLYYYNDDFKWYDKKQSDLVAANILNLCLKGYIIFEKKDKKINISIAKTEEGLKNDEIEIYYLIKDAIGKDDYIEVSDLKKFAKEKFNKYSKHVTKMVSSIKENLYNEEIIDKKKEKLYNKTKSGSETIYAGLLITIILYFATGLIPINSIGYISVWGIDLLGIVLDLVIVLLPPAILLILIDRLHNKARNNICMFTQKGEDERTEWKGLARFLKDYSKIDEKGVFDIVIWEKYLVYATALGISDKVIEELHAKYPYVFTDEYWQGTEESKGVTGGEDIYGIHKIRTKGIIDMACNPTYSGTNCNFSNFTEAIHTSYRTMTSTVFAHYSSFSGGGFSSGGGGGFSSGGGGRWRRCSEWVEDKNYNKQI